MKSTRRPDRLREAGFTLVEVMTVVFIIGLTSSLVILTMPDSPKPIERTADTFAADIRASADRAILTGRPQGVLVTEGGYTLVEWRGEAWRARAGNAERSFESFQLDLRRAERSEDAGQPDIVFDPTGVNDPVDLLLRGRGERFVLSISATGEVTREAR